MSVMMTDYSTPGTKQPLAKAFRPHLSASALLATTCSHLVSKGRKMAVTLPHTVVDWRVRPGEELSHSALNRRLHNLSSRTE